jgi:hypothetical protein
VVGASGALLPEASCRGRETDRSERERRHDCARATLSCSGGAPVSSGARCGCQRTEARQAHLPRAILHPLAERPRLLVACVAPGARIRFFLEAVHDPTRTVDLQQVNRILLRPR